MSRGPVDLHPTDDFTDLVLHVLAHMPIAEPGNLHDPRYVAWARASMPAPEAEWLSEGAAVLGRAWAAGAPPVVHAWPELFDSIEAFYSVAAQELASLRPEQTRAPEVLRAAQRAGGADLELFHATLGALAPWYSEWRARIIAPLFRKARFGVSFWVGDVLECMPTLAQTRLELACALGAHGRAFPTRIVVGIPTDWNFLDERLPAVLAMHEQMVRESGESDYVEAEWAALIGLAARVAGLSIQMRNAHSNWLASLELGPLLDGLLAEGRIEAQDHQALTHDIYGRARQLLAIGAR